MSRNSERALLLLVGVLAGAVGALLLKGHLLTARSIASLEEQKRCADQAQVFFKKSNKTMRTGQTRSLCRTGMIQSRAYASRAFRATQFPIPLTNSEMK